MDEILSNYSLNEILMYGIFIGFLFSLLNDILLALYGYLSEKAWHVKDYEKIIYENLNTYDANTEEEKEIIAIARNNYKKYLERRKKIDNFFNKFKRKSED